MTETIVETSYGIIPYIKINNQPLFLVVHQKDGPWSFPKGHPEKNETGIETAKRELFEETGISKITLRDEKFEVKYQFERNSKKHIKNVVYFLAEVNEEAVEPPTQFKNEILECSFVDIAEARSKINFIEYEGLFINLEKVSRDL